MKYLHRHPCELDLTIDQIAEVAAVGKQIEANQAEALGSIFGGAG